LIEALAENKIGNFQILTVLLNSIELGDEAIKRSIHRNIDKLQTDWPKPFKPQEQQRDRALAEAFVHAYYLLKIVEHFDLNHVKNAEIFKGGHVCIADDGKLVEFLRDHMMDHAHSPGLFNRYSSHYKDEKKNEWIKDKVAKDEAHAEKLFNVSKPDFSLRAEGVFNEACMGTFTREGKAYSWFQFEGHSHQARQYYSNGVLTVTDALIRFMANLVTAKFIRDRFSKDNSGPAYSLEKFLHHLDFVRYCRGGKKKNIGQYGESIHADKNPIEVKFNS
jgi:hypothetical protein